MSKKIKILCNIDIFAKANKNKKHKSGIFYAYRSIIENFILQKNIDITFAIFEQKANYARDFYKTNKISKTKINIYNTFIDRAIYDIKLVQAKIRDIKKSNIIQKQNPITYLIPIFNAIFIIAKIVLSTTIKLLQYSKLDFISKIILQKKISKYDYFLSYNHKIPTIIKNNKNIIKCIILHDMIPYLFPELTSTIVTKYKIQKTKDNFIAELNSLDEEAIIICNSHNTKNDLIKILPKYKNSQNIITAPFAADDKKFSFLEKNKNNLNKIHKTLNQFKIDINKPYFLSVCSLNPRKNLDFLIKSFVEFVKKHNLENKINLVLVGEVGWEIDKIFAEQKKIDTIKDSIIFTGFVDDEHINYLYNGSFCFVCPSIYEGFGIPIVEAMYCHLPIITSKNSSLFEVAGKDAMFIDPYSQDTLIEALTKIYFDKDYRNNLIVYYSKRGQEFSWQKTSQIIADGLLNKIK